MAVQFDVQGFSYRPVPELQPSKLFFPTHPASARLSLATARPLFLGHHLHTESKSPSCSQTISYPTCFAPIVLNSQSPSPLFILTLSDAQLRELLFQGLEFQSRIIIPTGYGITCFAERMYVPFPRDEGSCKWKSNQ